MKHPLVIGALNALIPGLGYLIIRERMVFGTLLIAGSIALLILAFVEPVFRPQTLFVSSSILGQGLESLWYIFFILAYGYDAYALAREQKSKELALAPLPPTGA